MKTRSLSEEILYYCSLSHAIKNALDTFGIAKIDKAFFVV